jgi:hypothetical protein
MLPSISKGKQKQNPFLSFAPQQLAKFSHCYWNPAIFLQWKLQKWNRRQLFPLTW